MPQRFRPRWHPCEGGWNSASSIPAPGEAALKGGAVDSFLQQFGGMIVVAFVVAAVVVFRYVKRGGSGAPGRFAEDHARKSEALFQSMFPELQPHFHPARLVEYVKARRARRPPASGMQWKNPPGFAAAVADIKLDGGRERVRLVDAAGALLGEFLFEEHAEGGVLRVGKGKITVNTRETVPRVRYWHPDREFKWTPSSWKFQSRVADRSIDSDDRGTSYSGSSSSSPSSTATTAAAAAGIVAAGGTFDGGGASGGWDEGGPAGSTDSSGSSESSGSSDSSDSSGGESSGTSY